jgi:hypothetical protein
MTVEIEITCFYVVSVSIKINLNIILKTYLFFHFYFHHRYQTSLPNMFNCIFFRQIRRFNGGVVDMDLS